MRCMYTLIRIKLLVIVAAISDREKVAVAFYHARFSLNIH